MHEIDANKKSFILLKINFQLLSQEIILNFFNVQLSIGKDFVAVSINIYFQTSI